MTNKEKLREIFPHVIFIEEKENGRIKALVCSDEWLISEYKEPIDRYHSRNIRAYAEDMGISVEQAEKELLKEVENENEEICNG